MPGKRYTFVLNFGYVESASTSYMPWVSKNTYKDAKEALVDLATYLKEQYENQHGAKAVKKCCAATKAKDADAIYCTKCGKAVAVPEINQEHLIEWFRQLDCLDVDSFHGIIEYDGDARWNSEGLEGTPNQRFVYQAEWVLAAALGYNHRDDTTFEDICKARTKSKVDSFCY